MTDQSSTEAANAVAKGKLHYGYHKPTRRPLWAPGAGTVLGVGFEGIVSFKRQFLMMPCLPSSQRGEGGIDLSCRAGGLLLPWTRVWGTAIRLRSSRRLQQELSRKMA